MQYPQIQFYRGSLVRLASGKLKQVEDLSSDDFLEGAQNNAINNNHDKQIQPKSQPQSQQQLTSLLDRNNNNTRNHCNSVFNSPEPTSSSYNSPEVSMIVDTDEDDDLANKQLHQQMGISHHQTTNNSGQHTNHQFQNHNDEDEYDDELEVDVVSDEPPVVRQQPMSHQHPHPHPQLPVEKQQPKLGRIQSHSDLSGPPEDVFIDSGVVRDFLEVRPHSSLSPRGNAHSPFPSTSTSTSSLSSAGSSSSSPLLSPSNPSLLVKLSLESTKSVAFIEVPIEHPFFVFHRGWSSWHPQKTFEKFGLKCRKLKIGDSCITLIRRPKRAAQTPATGSLQNLTSIKGPASISRPFHQLVSHAPSMGQISQSIASFQGHQAHNNRLHQHHLHQLQQMHNHFPQQPQSLHLSHHDRNQMDSRLVAENNLHHRRQQKDSDHCNMLFSSIKLEN